MKVEPVKYTKNEITKIDLGTKVIYKYPTPMKLMDIARMVIDGRNPKGENKFLLETECTFVIYIIKGKGKIYAGDKIFNVEVDDVVFVPKNFKFAAEGKMEYITVDSPAFFPEQSEEIVA
jgi:mannose-6-phosphate isomerase-like protein (cupin superfamily)